MKTQREKRQRMAVSPVKEAILRRVKVLYVLFFVAGIAVLGRIVWLQTGDRSDQLRTLSEQYSYRTETIEAARGNIYSDDGRALAISIPYYELRMDMRAGGLTDRLFVTQVDSLSGRLAAFFGDKSAAQYSAELRAARAEGKRYHLVAARAVDFLELQQIRQFPLFRLGANGGGFIAIESSRRVKPYGELAGRTIGFVNQSGAAVGIEGAFDHYLRGTTGRAVKQKIAGNFWTPIASDLNLEPVDGIDVVSTIQVEMQDMVQKALREWVVEARADWGCVAVMEVATGDVKAIANITRRPDGRLVEDYNYVIGMGMEPGSTFKLPVLVALLEDGKMPLSTRFDTGDGVKQVGIVRVVDSRAGGYGRISLQEVFEHSSNIGMAQAVNSLYQSDPARLVDAIGRLGIGRPLGIQLSGEARPLIKHPGLKNGWDGTTLTMMSYGYAVRLAPIHTLALYNAVANNGVMVKPMFVRGIARQDRMLIAYPTDTINPQIAPPATLQVVRRALEGVVINGTGQLLGSPHYRVAAKTGTAQVAMGRSGYTTSSGGRHYLGSVVGYMPAERPRYTIIVALKTYHVPGMTNPYYGGQLAGPLFRTVTDRLYALNNGFAGALVQRAQTYDVGLRALPGPGEELRLLLEQLRVMGAPTVAEPLSGESPAAPLAAGVPDLLGMTLEQALAAAEGAGLRPRFRGIGIVTGQSPGPGSAFEPGQELQIDLALPLE